MIAIFGRVAVAHFAEDHAAFFFDFRFQHEKLAGVVAHQRHALGHHFGLGVGQVDVVGGLVEAGVRVDVASERHAEALEVVRITSLVKDQNKQFDWLR